MASCILYTFYCVRVSPFAYLQTFDGKHGYVAYITGDKSERDSDQTKPLRHLLETVLMDEKAGLLDNSALSTTATCETSTVCKEREPNTGAPFVP